MRSNRLLYDQICWILTVIIELIGSWDGILMTNIWIMYWFKSMFNMVPLLTILIKLDLHVHCFWTSWQQTRMYIIAPFLIARISIWMIFLLIGPFLHRLFPNFKVNVIACNKKTSIVALRSYGHITTPHLWRTTHCLH